MRKFSYTLPLITVACIAASGVLAFNFTGGKWGGGRATFHVAIPGFAPTGQSWSSAFVEAMDKWTAQTDFTFDADPTPVDPCAGFFASSSPSGFPAGGGDSRNSADFRNTVCGNAFGANVLALTLTFTQVNRLGYDNITQTDIIFNANRNWDIYSGPLRSSIDFARVALHELGHALGLGHENNVVSIMSSNAGSVDSLQVDDIAGVSSLYGARGNCAFSTINPNTSIDQSLQAGDCRVMDLFGGNDDPSFMDVYQFRLAEPTFVNINMQSNELDSVIILTNTALGNQMIFDDSNGTCDAQVAQVLPAGDYLLLANTYVVPEKCAGNVGSYSLAMTNSTLPSLGSVANTSPAAPAIPMVFSGGASVDGVNFRTNFSARELIQVKAQLAIDPAHVGQAGSVFVVAMLSNGKQYMKNSSGAFVPFAGGVTNLVPYRQGALSTLEDVTVIENLRGGNSSLAGLDYLMFVGYSLNSAPLAIYRNMVPIRFSIARD